MPEPAIALPSRGLFIALVGVMIALAVSRAFQAEPSTDVPYSEFAKALRENRVRKLEIGSTKLVAHIADAKASESDTPRAYAIARLP